MQVDLSATTATKPLSYDNLQRAMAMLEKPRINPNITILSRSHFDFVMLCAKHYQGKQIIKRNHKAQSKNKRYRKTWTVPNMTILNEECIQYLGVKLMPAMMMYDAGDEVDYNREIL